MVVSAPMNESELRNLMYTAQKENMGPFCIRYPRGKGVQKEWKTVMKSIPVGKGRKLTDGKDLAILSIGHPGNFAQEAIQQGFVIGDNELNSFVTQIPAFQVDGQFSKMQFQATVNRLMYTPEEFMTEMRNNLLINQARNGIASSSFALPYEGQRFSQLMSETRNIAYMIIPSTHFLGTVKLTDKNMNNYFQTHRSNYTTPEKVSISYIEITPKSIEHSINPTLADLKNYYETNISDYTTPARWHVAHILLNVPKNASAEQIKMLKEKLTKIRGELKGQSFSALAAKYSEDILTSKKRW